MTGKGILEALSFVDEGYIEEAENGKMRRANPAWKLLPLAACLCLACLGLFHSHWTNPAEEIASAEQETAGEMPETVVQEKSDGVMYDPSDIAMDEAELKASYTCEQLSAIVRIDEWLDTGFQGTLVEPTWTNYLKVGTQLTILPVEDAPLFIFEIITSETASKLEYRIPTPEELPEGSIVRIQFHDYDLKNETLYITWITSDLREWED